MVRKFEHNFKLKITLFDLKNIPIYNLFIWHTIFKNIKQIYKLSCIYPVSLVQSPSDPDILIRVRNRVLIENRHGHGAATNEQLSPAPRRCFPISHAQKGRDIEV